MAFVIIVINWILWTVENMYWAEIIISFWNHSDVRNTMWLDNTLSKHKMLI